MLHETQPHPDEEQIERYCRGELRDDENLDEHLLLCDGCRRRVAEMDEYVAAMTRAAAELRRAGFDGSRQTWFRNPRTWWGAAATLAAAAMIWIAVTFQNEAPAAAAVALAVSRAASAGSSAPAGAPLALSPDLTGVPEDPSYHLEVVDHLGNPVWRGPYPGPAASPLPSGAYFVRLYSTEGELYREYALQVRPR